MITNWAKCLSGSPSLPSAILPQFLLFNLNIKIDKKSIFIFNLGKSINFVSQIFHRNGKTKSWDYIKWKYNVENKLNYRWIQWTDILSKLWKDRILNYIGNLISLCILDLIPLEKIRSRELYQIQVSEKYEKPTSQLYYEKYFNKFDFNWTLTYILPQMVPVDTKLRVFYYKILNNILFMNKMLFEFRKLNHHCVRFAKLKMQLTYISFIAAENFHFMETTSGVF